MNCLIIAISQDMNSREVGVDVSMNILHLVKLEEHLGLAGWQKPGRCPSTGCSPDPTHLPPSINSPTSLPEPLQSWEDGRCPSAHGRNESSEERVLGT